MNYNKEIFNHYTIDDTDIKRLHTEFEEVNSTVSVNEVLRVRSRSGAYISRPTNTKMQQNKRHPLHSNPHFYSSSYSG